MLAPVYRVGNLTSDPELHFTPEGKLVANFDLAYEPYDAETKQRGETEFYGVNVWEGMAENVTKTLKKGMRVIVVGIPKMRKWQYESKDYSKREITVIAIGPDLRWATADVTRIGSRDSDGRKHDKPADDDPWATAE